MSHAYATTAQLRAALGNPSTSDAPESALLAALEAASAEVDRIAGRTFATSLGPRYYTAQYGNDLIEVDDLLSATSIKTDSNGDRTYATIWAATDYDLEPFNAAVKGKPYERIRRRTGGDYHFVRDQRQGVEVDGLWGYSSTLRASGVTADEDLDASETDIDVSAAALLGAGMTVRIDSEDMYVTALAEGTPDTMTVGRAQGGTTAAAHLTGTAISVYVYPPVVVRTTLELALGSYRSATGGGGTVRSYRAGDIAIEYAEGSAAAEASSSESHYRAQLAPVLRRRLFS